MKIAEATERACVEPTLLLALSWICLWESERVVKQAHKNLTSNTPSNPDTGQMWDTCFELCLKSVMDNYIEIPKGWTIEYVPKTFKGHDWEYSHDDHDGENGLCGSCVSRQACLDEIAEVEL